LYGFKEEFNQVNSWLQEKFGTTMKVFDLKSFYEGFSDEGNFAKVAWDVSNYLDSDSNARDTSFKIKVSQGEKIELSRIYKSLDAHLNSEYRDFLKGEYLEYCDRNGIEADEYTLDFLDGHNNLTQSEMIFRGIQQRCEYLIGSIRQIAKKANQEIQEKVRYNFEKVADGVGVLRTTKESYEYFEQILPKIRDHFEPLEASKRRPAS
jgi:hypothetical protein